MGAEVEMELFKVVIREDQDSQLIHLREKGGERNFPIVIGIHEAAEIHRKLKGMQPMRPLTHDLIASMLTSMGCRVDRVVVSDLRNSTYYASIHLIAADGSTHEIDARPSDAIALAVQLKVPIRVNEDVFAKLNGG